MHTIEISEIHLQDISHPQAAKRIFETPLDCGMGSKAFRAVLCVVLAAILIPVRIQDLGWALNLLFLLGGSVFLLWFYFKQVACGLANAASFRTDGLSGSLTHSNVHRSLDPAVKHAGMLSGD